MSTEDLATLHLLPAWRNALREMQEGRWTYGSLISMQDLQTIMDLQAPTQGTAEQHRAWQFAWLQNIEALKSHALEELNMLLVNERGNGYKILSPAEQTDYAQRAGYDELRGALRRMGRRITYTDRAQLTAEQARENADAAVRVAAISTSISQIQRGALPDIPKRLTRAAKRNPKAPATANGTPNP